MDRYRRSWEIRRASLALGYNELDGEMPEEFGKLVDLLSLSLTGNHLSRKIPPELDDLVNLAWLDLSHTRLMWVCARGFARPFA